MILPFISITFSTHFISDHSSEIMRNFQKSYVFSEIIITMKNVKWTEECKVDILGMKTMEWKSVIIIL